MPDSVTMGSADGRIASRPANARPVARPGTPGLLRELNDRAALELLLPGDPLTRAQLAEATGVSKVTVAQMLTRLEDRGLVHAVGEVAGGRGPNAVLYSVMPSSAYVAALYVESGLVSTAVADVTGRTLGEVRENPDGAEDLVALIRGAVDRACRQAGVPVSALSSFVIGSPGVIDPSTGERRFAVRVPAWHEGVLADLRGALRRPPVIENDVNLAAIAEWAHGAAAGVDDFVLVWIGVGLGMAISLGGRLHRGATGAAGEIGYLPLPATPVASDVRRPSEGGFQWLAGAEAVQVLARAYGFEGKAAGDSVRAAVEALNAARTSTTHSRAREFVGQLAHRVALGVTSVCTVLDPGLVVLGGEVGLAGGTELSGQVSDNVARMFPAYPRIVPTEVPNEPVLRGALLAAVDQARTDLLASVGA
jgi:predicted NBD/HSP70 family sugar kinase